MFRRIAKALGVVLSGAAAVLMQTTPESLVSNITKWLLFFHIAVPEFLKRKSADTLISVICLLLFAYFLCAVIRDIIAARKSASVRQPYPDMPISDALNYIVNDSSIELKKPMPQEIEQLGGAKGYLVNWPGIGHDDALSKVQSALNNGSIDAWGHREIAPNSFESSFRPIPKEYWESACLNHFYCFHRSDQAQTMPLPMKTADRFANLTLNRKQVRELWRPTSLWRRCLMDLRFIQRKNYSGRSLDRKYNHTKLEEEQTKNFRIRTAKEIEEFNAAAKEFRRPFNNILAVLQSRDRGIRPDVDEILEDAYPKLLKAVNEFRQYLPVVAVANFDKAWDEFCRDEYSIAMGLDKRNFKQYADDATGLHDKYPRRPDLMAVERIGKLLDFANPRRL